MNYLGLCSNVRRTDSGEAKWHAMMAGAIDVPIEALILFVGIDGLEDVLGGEFDSYHAQDPSAKACVSIWGDESCMFYQNAGFEYIWVFN